MGFVVAAGLFHYPFEGMGLILHHLKVVAYARAGAAAYAFFMVDGYFVGHSSVGTIYC